MRGIYLEAELLNSEAFRSLSKWGLHVYLLFLARRVMVKEKHKSKADARTIANNGEIVFCYTTAEKMGISRRNFRDALDELIAKGFLDINHQGAGGRSKDKSTYFVCNRWKKWNTPDYKQTPTPRIKNTKDGQGWAVFNARKNQLSVPKTSPERPLSSDHNDTPKEKKRVFRVTKTTPEKTHEIAVSF